VPADNIPSYLETRQQDSAAIDNSLPSVEGITKTSDILLDSEAGVLEDEDIISDLLDNSLINNVLDQLLNDQMSSDSISGKERHHVRHQPVGPFCGIRRGVEYLSDSSSDNEPAVMEVCNVTSKRKRKKQNVKMRATAKVNRLMGKPYMGYHRQRNGKVEQKQARAGRGIQTRCDHVEPISKGSWSFMCTRVTEQKRLEIFDKFWVLDSWSAKKAFVNGLVAVRDARKRRPTNKISGKKENNVFHDCYLPGENGEKVRVCKKLFLGTLSIGRDQFMRWCHRKSCDKDSSETDRNTAKASRKDQRRNDIDQWLELLPKVPSHYCRASSSKTYVDSTFRSLNNMYDVYTENAKERGIEPLSRQVFVGILKEKKIGIHLPRKDQCDTCTSFNVGAVSRDEYNRHIEKKDEARRAKNEAKASCGPEKMVITMDLQSILLCPKIEASVAYYKMKLQVHNFTVYRLNDGAVKLFVWHEGNGGVTSNEFVSCIIDYIRQQPSTVKSFVLISDGCGYQNRNRVLASALRNLAVERECEIEQLYLERGHTMMEADSVHATLDNLFKGGPIYSPSDYLVLMRQARKGQLYEVQSVDHTFFLDYEHLNGNLASIRPGKKTGDAQVADIRALQYTSTGCIRYKIRHTDLWSDLPVRKSFASTATPQHLYQKTLKITAAKFKHLQELKSLIPNDYHSFYDSLQSA